MKNQLLRETIYDLRDESLKYKRENSLLSYQDMINLVNDALNNEKLKTILQQRYKYGIVDEFQDTDPIQYEIFTKIFLESNDNKLFIIGDPKQAIYGFRGADIYTYFKARDDFSKFTAPHILDSNYRSCEDIINDYNEIFNNNWFDKNYIDYRDVNYPKREDEPKIYYQSKEYSTTIIKLQGKLDYSSKKKFVAKWMAYEILRVLDSDISYTLKGKSKKLDLSDIAILVDTKNDAEIIENELDSLNIKHSFYKKSGLYRSREAKNIYFLLKTLSTDLKDDTLLGALLTDFFGVNLEILINKEELISQFYDIFVKWQDYSLKKEYSKLFDSVINDTGVFFRLRENNDWDRTITNYNHIFQNLLIEAENNNLSINELVNLLKNYIEKNVTIEEIDDLHRLETEEPKVKILTIHVSKGLEFPIVFIFGGFDPESNNNKNKNYYKFYKDNKTHYDIAKCEENKISNKQYEIFEKKRLYYVAITRAIFKLYFPIIVNEKEENNNFLTKSLLNLKRQTINYIELTEKEINTNENQYFDDEKKIIINDDAIKYNIPEELFLTYDNNLKYKKISLLSFSGIKREKELTKKFGEKNLNDFDDADDIIDEDLPGGVLIGNMFHKIFEDIDYTPFQNFKSHLDIKNDAKVNKIILENIKNYLLKYEKKNSDKTKFYEEIIYKKIFNV
ncbi:MAG TPA: 3'-5' exonuclease, partial [Spirochaetota bacterium]|nr:3'-5' exonuclease [Spirochaetota bacterium]